MTPRVPIYEVVVVGTGFSGLGMAVRLKQAGIDDFLVFEAASGVGGTWRDNHYPGAACDVMSHLYSFSFEHNPSWSHSFARQKEILDYLDHCADKYDVRRHIRFDAAVTKATWDEASGTWEILAKDGSRVRARALVSGSGGINRPSYPDVPGWGSFAGKVMHSARWDDDAKLEGKRIAVIGTGASAIQIVPELAKIAGHLTVFQRTAPWIVPRRDAPFSERAKRRFSRAPWTMNALRAGIYARNEVFALGFMGNETVMRLGEWQGRKHLEAQVSDPVLRKKLTPTFRLGCKRVLISNDYYPALTQSNVTLETEAIASVEPKGIRTKDGKLHEVDVIVCATGFFVADFAAPFELTGRGGKDLSATWKKTPEVYLGTTMAGFPNFFIVFGPNTGLGHNSMVYMIESQIAYVMSALRQMKERRLKSVEVLPDVQRKYNERIQARLAKTIWASGCKSWYIDQSGKNTTLWPGFTFEFRARTRHFDLADYRTEQATEPLAQSMTEASPLAN